MSKNTLILFIVFLTAIIGCTEKQVKKKIVKPIDFAPFVLNMQHFFGQGDFSPSFPVWFNDSIISKQKINRITRKSFVPFADNDSLVEELNAEYIYEFAPDGRPKSYTINSYYDNLLFESVTFKYTDVNKKSGFALFTTNRQQVTAPTKLNSHIEEYIFIEQDDRYSIYKEKSAGYYLMFMEVKEFWGAISIDTILHPSVVDWVVLGSPKYPVKKYRVENTVKLSNVKDYIYGEKGKTIKKIVDEDYPFIQSRSILYSASGQCSGFIDSIFTDQKFLSRKLYFFKLDEKGLPKELERKGSIDSSNKMTLQKETFKYDYY